jgi:hypothetical protein
MTEQEWLESPSPYALLRHLWRARPYSVTARKQRLLACACLRRVWHTLSRKGRHAVEVAELHADRLVPAKELEAARPPFAEGRTAAFYAVYYAAAPNKRLRAEMEWVLANSTCAARGGFQSSSGLMLGTAACSQSVAQSRLVRDVFRNPFRPVTVSPRWRAWNDGTVGKLARGVYDERAFDRLPVLADALEEAGCADAALLAHCREPGAHVRGCWVVDLLLGKS